MHEHFLAKGLIYLLTANAGRAYGSPEKSSSWPPEATPYGVLHVVALIETQGSSLGDPMDQSQPLDLALEATFPIPVPFQSIMR